MDKRPLVAHVMYRFDTGGLENGIVNLINHMPESAYRHAIVSLTEITEFRQRIQRRRGGQIALQVGGGVQLHLAPGDGLMLGACLAWAAYNVLTRRWMPSKVGLVPTETAAGQGSGSAPDGSGSPCAPRPSRRVSQPA